MTLNTRDSEGSECIEQVFKCKGRKMMNTGLS